ncbi:winged helix-turn-helix transcriptional regulator [Algisphaera agarilytica]|uniref:DNA-binding HxlR family transcriptional regulator n=1 Tax=Algisphaera agarilytica TaxID=1385975 RepID=A0A7X0LKS0_9BACT|nr:helix-turn-helix domain-containing protein [Algisphaera agarilytica]MBB6429916.1 DNA-binding HxlR family transcriptional regulator [Algisphaera agarilytica]
MSKDAGQPSCPIAQTLGVFAGKWKPEILWNLKDQRLRFNELQRAVGGVSQKMLAQQLRELQRDGLVKRIQHQSIPPHVEYEATSLIKTLEPIFGELERWYKDNAPTVRRAQKKYAKNNPS